MGRPVWRVLWAVAGLAIVVRVLFVVVVAGSGINPGGAPGATDAQAYHEIAIGLLSGHGFAHEGQPTAYRPPLYPSFIALVYQLAGRDNFLALRIAQAILGGLTSLLLGRIACTLTGSALTGVLAALLLAFNPFHLYFTAMLYTEVLFGALLVVTIWLLSAPVPSRGRVFLSGVSLGLAILTRSTALALIPVALASLVLRGVSGITGRGAALRGLVARPALESCLILLLGIAGVVSPWTVRNTLLFGEFTPLTTNSGINLVHGLGREWTDSIGAGHLALTDRSMPLDVRVWPGSAVHEPAAETSGGARAPWHGNESRWDKALVAFGLERMREQPGRFLRLYLRKWLHFFSPVLSAQQPPQFRWIGAVAFLPLLLGFLLWPLVCWRDASARARAAYVLIGSGVLLFSLAHSFYITDVRFRVPVAEPCFMIFAADVLRVGLAAVQRRTAVWGPVAR